MKNKCFNEVFSEFILNMEQIPPNIVHPHISAAIADICRFLRISYFHASLEIRRELNEGEYEMRQAVYFSEGKYNNELLYVLKKNTPGGIATYTVYPHNDDTPWTEEEIKNIDLFLTTFFIFNGRARAMTFCEEMMFHDSDL